MNTIALGLAGSTSRAAAGSVSRAVHQMCFVHPAVTTAQVTHSGTSPGGGLAILLLVLAIVVLMTVVRAARRVVAVSLEGMVRLTSALASAMTSVVVVIVIAALVSVLLFAHH